MCIIKFDFKDSIIYSAHNHFNITNVKHLHMVVSKSYLMQYFIFAYSKQRGMFNAFCLLLGPKRLVILVLYNICSQKKRCMIDRFLSRKRFLLRPFHIFNKIDCLMTMQRSSKGFCNGCVCFQWHAIFQAVVWKK